MYVDGRWKVTVRRRVGMSMMDALWMSSSSRDAIQPGLHAWAVYDQHGNVASVKHWITELLAQ